MGCDVNGMVGDTVPSESSWMPQSDPQEKGGKKPEMLEIEGLILIASCLRSTVHNYVLMPQENSLGDVKCTKYPSTPFPEATV